MILAVREAVTASKQQSRRLEQQLAFEQHRPASTAGTTRIPF